MRESSIVSRLSIVRNDFNPIISYSMSDGK
jgi:hypothetical protein